MIDHDRIAKLILETFQPPGITKEEEKKLKEAMEYWDGVFQRIWQEEKCFSCGRYFQAKNWHTPPSCPYCHRSRVD